MKEERNMKEHQIYKLTGLTSAPQDRIERYGHAIFGNCHIKLKEVQFHGQKFMGKGIMDTAGSFRLF